MNNLNNLNNPLTHWPRMETITLYASEPKPTFSPVQASYHDLLEHPERFYQVFEAQLQLLQLINQANDIAYRDQTLSG
jgi:hypothetical protein